MRIEVTFHFKDSPEPVAHTGVEDNVTDLLLPSSGDLVSHRDASGHPFTGRVAERAFAYDLPAGPDISGTISITLFLDRVLLH